MRVSIALLALVFAFAAGELRFQQQPASVSQFPSVAALLRTVNFATGLTACGGAILNNRSILTAARCFQDDGPERWRARVGSSAWNSSGIVYSASEIIIHDNWDEWAMGTDIAILRLAAAISFGGNVQPGSFAGPNYVIPLNAPLTVIGWGYTAMPIWSPSHYPELRQVALTNFDNGVCQPFYSSQGFYLRNDQICSGFLNPAPTVEGINKCFGEPGTPVYHNGVIVGIRSYSVSCLFVEVPSVNTRVSSFINWASQNA